VLYSSQVHGLEVLSSDQVGVQIQTMVPDTLNFSDSILPEAAQDLHPLQTTQHLEVIHRVTVTDIIEFKLEEHFAGNFDPVFGGRSCFQLQIYSSALKMKAPHQSSPN